MSKGPPYICVVENTGYGVHTWCGRDISISRETRYDLNTALHKDDPITCPQCIYQIRGNTYIDDLRPPPQLGWQEALLPFVAMGFFIMGVSLDVVLFCIPSVLIMGYVAVRMVRQVRAHDRVAKDRLDALLQESPNHGLTCKTLEITPDGE